MRVLHKSPLYALQALKLSNRATMVQRAQKDLFRTHSPDYKSREASAAEAEAFSAAARLSMPTPAAPPGLGPVLESSIEDAAGEGSRALPRGGDRHDRGEGGSMVRVR